MFSSCTMLLRSSFAMFATVVTLAVGHSAIAGTVIGPVPFGDVPGPPSFAASGDSGSIGGATFTFDNYDFTVIETAFWGFDTDFGINLEMDRNYPGRNNFFGDPGEMMSFAGIGASVGLGSNQARWTGATLWPYFGDMGETASPVDTRFTLTATDLADAPLALLDPTTIPELTHIFGAGVAITSGGFKVNVLYEAQSPFDASWVPARTLFNSRNGVPGVQIATSSGGVSYYSVPVPEPSAWVLAICGGALGWLVRRRGE